MKDEKWQKINELFHDSLEIESEKRLQFIRENSNGDAEVFAEVQKLISAHEEAKSFIQTPVANDAFEILSGENTAAIIAESENFPIDKKIGRFEVIEKIGKGGMGEVFLARDDTLERNVAVKILTSDFTSDSLRVNRFIREAKAASALNHPNILTIHEIGEYNGTHFMAAEFVNGKTLTEALSQEPPTLNKILKISIQIVSALEAAHEAGIVHRDIKSDNIMIRRDGIVKVLDFGLAKLLESEDQRSKVKDQKSTMQGLIMGTPNYMSPEQARGKDVDFQTDIFSFGVVLYQMLSGKLPFRGETINDTIAAILTKEPEPLNDVAPELEKIVNKTLQKDKRNRYQTAKSLRQDLEEIKEELQLQDRLEKSFVPNSDEQKTRVLQAVTANEVQAAAIENQSNKSYKSYILLGLLSLLILISGYFGYKFFNLSKQIDSIAVIPFINKTNNAEMEYLSDGMTETLINSLSKIPSLNVKARSSVFRYKGNEKDFKKIASELNVQAILTGEVIQRGDQLILSLELIDTETDNQIWGNTYTRKQSEVVTLQNEIARDVFTNLKAKFAGEETAKVLDSGTTNAEAFQLYLKGRYWITAGNFEKNPENIAYFQKTIELDPNFALGYVGLADAYTLLGTIVRAKMPVEEAMPKAKAAAEKAIELNPNLSEAYTSRGWIKFRFDWDWAGAEKDFKKAIELRPTNATARQWYSEFLYTLRRYEESIDEMKIARDLEPFSNLILWNYGKQLYYAKRYDEAALILKKSLEADENNWRVYNLIIGLYHEQGKAAEAFDYVMQEAKYYKYPADRISVYEQSFRQKGIAEVLRKRAEFRLQDAEREVPNFYIQAVNYLQLGKKQRVLDMLEKGYSERSGGMVNIYGDHRFFDALQNEPRYKELLRKMNFPQ